MYYDIALTLRSKRLLRISIRDLWEEGLVQGTLDNIGKGRGLQMDVITEALRQWCLEGIEPEQIAKSMKLSEAQVRKAIDLGMQVVITSIKPKHIRDEFLKVAMGERLPQFTAEEVAKLRSRRDWHLP